MAEDMQDQPVKPEKPRQLKVKQLVEADDIVKASVLDRQPDQFGDQGITEEQLKKFLEQGGNGGIALFDGENMVGFATYEIIQAGVSPKEYSGIPAFSVKTLFLQQFTTQAKYNIHQENIDAELLAQVEQKAKEQECAHVTEALAQTHPFDRPESELDVFGFYQKHGYKKSEEDRVVWIPGGETCYLFTKSL